MDTNLLNQYIFADLIEKQAQIVRRARLEDDSTSSHALTDEDFKQGFENLQYYRAQSLRILDNSEEII